MFKTIVFGICSGMMCAGCAISRKTDTKLLIYPFLGGCFGGLVHNFMLTHTGIYILSCFIGAMVSGFIVSHADRDDKFKYIFIATPAVYCLGRGIWPTRMFMYGFRLNWPMVLLSISRSAQIVIGNVLGLYVSNLTYNKIFKK